LVHTSSSEPRKRASLIDSLLPILILVFAALAIVLGVSGGIDLRPVGIRFSSRDPLRPAILAFVLALIYTALRREVVSGWLSWLGKQVVRFAPAIAAALSLYVIFLAMKFGTFVAGGSDSYGYVSQAWLWVNNGGPTLDQPFARDFSWPMADFSFAPLGYRAKLGGGGIVPIYAPGLPLLMALMIYPFGECGPFLVTPLLAGLLVWVTYKIGERATGSRPLALAATVLMASSPTFIFMAMAPMSDVPVAALFCSAVLTALTPMRGRAFITGLLVGISVLVRPNLAPMAAIFAAYLAWLDTTWRDRIITLIAFGVGCLPSAITIALIHTKLYGAPWKNGYGNFEALYALSFLGQNLRQFGTWLVETQTPLPLLFFVPFLAIRKLPAEQRPVIAFLGVFAAGIWLGYVFYLPFDAWWYLRFVLSSFPPLLILALYGSELSLRWMHGGFRTVVLIGIVASVASFQISRVQDMSVLKLWEGESVYYSTGRYLRRVLPENAVILSMQHSGSLRMYAERLTLRYDWLDNPEVYQGALKALVAKGYRPYLVMGDGEEPEFRARFKLPPNPAHDQPRDDAPGVLMAELKWPWKVRLYDPLRETPVEKPSVIPVLIPHPCRAFY
jgi:hypothetical protein